jgi:SAM-dependent methyltransferase
VIERRTVKTLAELRAAYNAVYSGAEYGEREALYELVLGLLGATHDAPVLDVGCGTGPFLGHATPRGLRCVGLDLSDAALETARTRGLGPLVHAQGERLPFGDGAFRFLVCLGNLEHFLDPSAGARELHRVLSPEGRAVVMLPNAYYSGDLWRLVTTGRGPDHHQAIDRFASCAEWRRLLEEAGLRIDSVHRWDKGKAWKRLFPFQLAYHFVYVAGKG